MIPGLNLILSQPRLSILEHEQNRYDRALSSALFYGARLGFEFFDPFEFFVWDWGLKNLS